MAAVKERAQRQLSPEEQLEREEAVFQRKLPQLLRRYAGQYVVIRKGRVVDHGPDDIELAFRMYKRFGKSVLLIAKVEEQPTIYEISSPEVLC
jgi:hypothetical protein